MSFTQPLHSKLEPVYKTYCHNPAHLFLPGASYMVTGATFRREKLFAGGRELGMLTETLVTTCEELGWKISAFAVLPNHYHLLAGASELQPDVARLVRLLHGRSARNLNALHGTPGRRVWWNYWDTCITNDRSFAARVNYIHFNPVRHRHVADSESWPYSSYPAFVAADAEAARRYRQEFPFDAIRIDDDC